MKAYSVDVSEVPIEIKILPLGHVESQKGNFEVDGESVNLILQQFKKRQLDLVIDYEHQTLSDIQAPAAGWIKDLYKADNAIAAKVEWTPKALEYLKNKEYRYLSPVVLTRKSDMKAVILHSVALTNTPAIDKMFPIINSIEKTVMSDDEAITLISQIKKILQLTDEADNEIILKTIEKMMKSKSDTDNEINVLKNQLYEQQVDEVIQFALKTGKISSAMINSARQVARYDIESFKDYVQSAPQVVPVGKIQYAADDYETLANKSRVNQLLDITEEDIKRYNK